MSDTLFDATNSAADSVGKPVTGTQIADKVRAVFGSLAIDKSRLPASRLLQRGIPSYVGEWVLDTIVPGDGPLSEDEAKKVQEWAARAIPRPDDHNIVRSRLLSGETVKALTPLQVDVILNRRQQDRLGKLALLGITDAHVSEELTRRFPDLLKAGMWGIVQLVHTQEGVVVADFKPMQATVDLALWREARQQFSVDEWRALLLSSLGYAPEAFTESEQSLLLCRLLPLVQKSMHLIELAPKGTGKSFIYENVSPQVRLVSGGNISPAVLFVNNANGLPGLLARFAVVVLDEVQTLKFEKPDEIVGGLKGYLANGQLTRGGLYQIASDCSFVLLANILLDEQQRPVNDLLTKELPPFLQETAFLDRLKGMIPGWEIGKLTSRSFSNTVGLKADFFGTVLLSLRDELEADQIITRRVRLVGQRVFKRNEDAVRAIASGLYKILFPHGHCTDAQLHQYCVAPAVRLRQLVWDQLYAQDAEYRQFEERLQAAIIPE